MNYDEYIERLNRLKGLFERRIIAIIPAMEQAAMKAIEEWIDEKLNVSKGNFVVDEDTADTLNEFTSFFMRALLRQKIYEGALTKFVKSLPELSQTMRRYQEAANGISWARAFIAPTEKVIVNEIVDAYTDNGLNSQFVQPVRDLLYQNVVAGTNVREAKETLKQYITGGKDKSGKLDRYLTQTAQQAVDSYTGAVNKKLMQTFDYDYLQMSGSLIKTSSPQCRKGINSFEGVITREVWQELEDTAEKNGLIEGTTFENLPFNKLHWGCRHEFTPTMSKNKNG